MANATTDALILALQTALTLRGEAVTYSRGSRSASLTAVRGRMLMQSEAAGEVRLEYTGGDWLFLLSDLVFPAIEPAGEDPGLAALPIAPEKGDRIATATETFEVLPPANSRVYLASEGMMMRVHCKQVNE
jgi:hypothetical protein